MLTALLSLPAVRFGAFLTSLLSLGRLTIPLTGPLIDPLIAPLMLSISGSVALGVVAAGDQDCLFLLLLFCGVSLWLCMTDRRNRLADSRETASLDLEFRFGEEFVYSGGSGLQVLSAFMRMRPAGVRRGKKSKLERLRGVRYGWACGT